MEPKNQVQKRKRKQEYSIQNVNENALRSRKFSTEFVSQMNALSNRIPRPLKQYQGKKTKKINVQKIQEQKKTNVLPKDYHPDKLKRNIKVKPIVLRSRSKLVKVGEMNKRKRTTPRKDASFLPSIKIPTVPEASIMPEIKEEQSIEELIRLTETEGLTDEDLIEILTCPSPVWWEATEYEEEPIMKHTENIEKEIMEISKQMTENNTSGSKLPEIYKNNDKYLKKRVVLENLLSNIKKHGNTVNDKDVSRNESKVECSNSQNATKRADKHVISMIYKELLAKRESTENKKGGNENINKDGKKTAKINSALSSERVDANKCESDEIDDKDIVIENVREDASDMNETDKRNKMKFGKRKHLFDDDNAALEELDKIDIPIGKRQKTEEIEEVDSLNYSNNEELEEKENSELKNPGPVNLPTLRQFSLDSPISIKTSETDDNVDNSSYVSIQDGLDTISDTNIQFLTDDMDSEEDSGSNSKDSKDFILKNNENQETTKRDKEEDCVIIYRIVDKDDDRPKEVNTFASVTEEAKLENGGNVGHCKTCGEKSKTIIKTSDSGGLAYFCSICLSVYKMVNCVHCENKKNVSGNTESLVCQICLCECCCKKNLMEHVSNHIGAM